MGGGGLDEKPAGSSFALKNHVLDGHQNRVPPVITHSRGQPAHAVVTKANSVTSCRKTASHQRKRGEIQSIEEVRRISACSLSCTEVTSALLDVAWGKASVY